MKNSMKFAAFVAAITTALPAFAHDDSKGPRIDDHAPIGVMADHAHKKGEWMTSLRWKNMNMGDPVNESAGPQSMSMNMIMVGVMYAPSDKVTFAGMVGYKDTSMDMTMMGNDMTAGASDISDARFSAIVPLVQNAESRLLVALGTSIPVGQTSKTNPAGTRLSLNMQPGTGSWGLMPSATYVRFLEGASLGVQASAIVWLNDNNFNERAGDGVSVTSWASYTVSDVLSVSGRLAYAVTGAVSGLVAQNLADRREAVQAFVGSNLFVGSHRFAVEAGLPLWQDRGLNALKQGFSLTVGWQKAF